ncbi:hypothetical protein IMZ48_00855 [Candidatus Bathyarchaeota archaeon]|nr:hypothetical protein [Candidatus Bathyarchaeota archaeon]
MDRYLMDHCHNYGKDLCDERVKTARGMWRDGQLSDASKGFYSRLTQADLDKICEACPHGLFEVEEPNDPICPVCLEGLWNIKKGIVEEGKINGEASPTPIYRFNCPQCKKVIFSKTNLWA